MMHDDDCFSGKSRHRHGCGTRDEGREEDRAERRSRRERQRERREELRQRMREARRARKGRVLHTRVSEQLSDDIRRLADDLRVPASNLVRNVLEEVFTVVESMSDDVGVLVDDVVEEAEAARERIRDRLEGRERRMRERRRRETDSRRNADPEAAEDEHATPPADRAEAGPDAGSERDRPEFAEVLGWQPLVLNRAAACADCARALNRGERAYAGLTERGLSATRLCERCLEAR